MAEWRKGQTMGLPHPPALDPEDDPYKVTMKDEETNN